MLLANVDWPSVAFAAAAATVVFFIGQRLLLSVRLWRAPGVRAPILGNYPFTALPVALRAVRLHNENRLMEFFDWIFSHSTPECPHTAEVVFFGKRLLLTTEPEHVKTLLTGKFAQFGKGADFHDAWKPFLGDSIFTTDGHAWQKSRALIRPMFLKDRVRDLEIFENGIRGLFEQLPKSGETVDMCDLFYRMTLDVTTEYLLGHSVGSLPNPKSRFSKAFTEVQRIQMVLTMLMPFRHFVPKPGYYSGIKALEEFMNPFIEETLAMDPDDLAKLSSSDRDATFLHNLAMFSRDRQVIRDQIMAVLLAGRDTTASTLSWTLYEISNYPEIWNKLRNLVMERVGPDGNPTYEDLKDLKYLTHCLNETLRLYPAVPYNIRTCLETSTLPGRPGQPDIKTLPGDQIAYSALSMQRRADLYPPVSETFADPAIYSPERWENWTPKAWTYVPFNGGPRICIGQNFAMTEMAYFMVRLLQKYERIEYRGDWSAQFHKAEVVGCPGQGVKVALFEAKA